MNASPMFVPLMTRWFHAFATGRKRIEWRPYGPRWNHAVAVPGRPVVLSHGYSGARLFATIVRTRRVSRDRAPISARELFPTTQTFCAIHLEISAEMPSKRRA